MTTAQPPNILFIHVDELRYPMHFPKGIETADAFMKCFMPNVHRHLWDGGVVFSRHYTAAADCSAARGTFVTGLYAQQTNLMIVRGTSLSGESAVEPPPLAPVFPTYGKLLREAGYDTPYIGKWHLSDAPATRPETYLQDYGFEGLTIPDPNGVAGQGIGEGVGPDGSKLEGDRGIAIRATQWLKHRAETVGPEQPFCLTVGFINPHDKQWFWNGPEGQTFADVFTKYDADAFSGEMQACFGSKFPTQPGVNIKGEADPPKYGYAKPDNWQSKQEMNAPGYPSLVPVFAALTDFTCGGISDDVHEEHFSTADSALCEGWTAAVAPHNYWVRALDMYTQAIENVDRAIGLLFDGIPPALRENLVVVFTSDHGEYASSHGLQGKGFTAYEETINVPLIVRDHTGRFTKSEGAVREHITSHVDLLRMLVSFAYGDASWMTGDYAQLYGNRLDLLPLLSDPGAPGRRLAGYTCDEVFLPDPINPGHAPQHVTALILPHGKLTLFSHWTPGAPPAMAEMFYYDRETRDGRLELQSSPSPHDAAAAWKMIHDEIRAPLPDKYHAAQKKALEDYFLYATVIAAGAELAVLLTNTPGDTCPLKPTQSVYLPTVNAP